MIHPAPTTKIDPKLARGTFLGAVAATATKPAYVTLTFPNTRYEMHLLPESPVATEPGKRILGTIHAQARRIDRVDTGGRYVEPVFGRPRRVQGRVVAIEGDEVVVHAGVPIHCRPTDSRQKAADFAEGDFVSFDVMDGATFRLEA
jgi:hypothetical protein